MVQEDVYDSLKEMIIGAMSELVVGDTDNYQVDIGPVIDSEAYEHLTKYISSNKAKIAYQTKISDKFCDKTSEVYKRLVQPTLLELKSFDDVITFSKSLTKTVVVTRGEKGAVAVNGDEVVECGIKEGLKIVDLTGAGDLFAGGFLHGHVNKMSLKDSLEKGTEMSSKVIQQIGARL